MKQNGVKKRTRQAENDRWNSFTKDFAQAFLYTVKYLSIATIYYRLEKEQIISKHASYKDFSILQINKKMRKEKDSLQPQGKPKETEYPEYLTEDPDEMVLI